MNEDIYVVKQPVTEALLETYYEMDTPKAAPTLLGKLRHWIHELRDFIVVPPPARAQVHLLVAPSLATTKP